MKILFKLHEVKATTGVPREKPQGGRAFFHPFQMRLAKKKAPPPSTIFSLLLKMYWFLAKGVIDGAFFHFCQPRLAEKKAPPPWGFSRQTPVCISLLYQSFRQNCISVTKSSVTNCSCHQKFLSPNVSVTICSCHQISVTKRKVRSPNACHHMY